MEAIRREAITQDAHWQALPGPSNEADQGLAVLWVVEDIHPPIPAVQDVVAEAAHCLSQRSWHRPALA